MMSASEIFNTCVEAATVNSNLKYNPKRLRIEIIAITLRDKSLKRYI